MKSYPRPLVTVDVVIIDKSNRILLIKRKNDPFKNCYALPGGFVEKDEDIEKAALRELEEETGITSRFIFGGGPHIVGAYGKRGRDPRGWTITIAYLIRLAPKFCLSGDNRERSDSLESRVFDCKDLPEMAFDHAEIITDALAVQKIRMGL